MIGLAPTPLPQPELPHAGMLAYISTATTPTRVRRIATRTLRILAILHLAFAAIGLLILAFGVVRLIHNHYHPTEIDWIVPVLPRGHIPAFAPPAPKWADEIREFVLDWSTLIIAIVIVATLGIVMWACAAPVNRGRKIPCSFAVCTLIPLAIALFGITLGAVGAGLGTGFGLIEHPANLWFLLWFFPAALAVLGILLLKDLAAFLLWIARNPITEKLPITFLPHSDRPMARPASGAPS